MGSNVTKIKSKFLPANYQINLEKKLQHLKQRENSVEEYTEEFYRSSIRADQNEEDIE